MQQPKRKNLGLLVPLHDAVRCWKCRSRLLRPDSSILEATLKPEQGRSQQLLVAARLLVPSYVLHAHGEGEREREQNMTAVLINLHACMSAT